MIGGSCVNVACLPSKNVIHSAKAVWLVHPTKGLGAVTGSMRVDDDLFRRLFFPTNRNLISRGTPCLTQTGLGRSPVS
jgi:hypothetical protein